MRKENRRENKRKEWLERKGKERAKKKRRESRKEREWKRKGMKKRIEEMARQGNERQGKARYIRMDDGGLREMTWHSLSQRTLPSLPPSYPPYFAVEHRRILLCVGVDTM